MSGGVRRADSKFVACVTYAARMHRYNSSFARKDDGSARFNRSITRSNAFSQASRRQDGRRWILRLGSAASRDGDRPTISCRTFAVILTALAVVSCVLAALPAYLFLRNWP